MREDLANQRRVAAAKALLRLFYLPSAWQLVLIGMSAAWYGFALGSYALFLPGHPGRRFSGQVLAAVVKVPLVILATAGVVFLVAMVLNLALGTRVGVPALWRLWLRVLLMFSGALVVLSPAVMLIGAFHNYALCVLSGYVLFALAGAVAALHLLMELRLLGRRGGHYAPRGWRFVMFWLLWTGAFAATALALGWTFRPYIGYAGQPFTWFRSEHATVFEQLYYEWHNLIGR